MKMTKSTFLEPNSGGLGGQANFSGSEGDPAQSLLLRETLVCLEGPYPFQLQCFNEHKSVIKVYGHKIYCKLKVNESRYRHRAKTSIESWHFQVRK